MHVFLGLTSNLADPEANLVLARDLLMKHDVLVLGQSDVKKTESGLFQVVECQTEHGSEQLALVCQEVEAEMGKPMEQKNLGNVHLGFGPKSTPDAQAPQETGSIGIQLLIYGERVLSQAAFDRAFVVDAVRELYPDFDPAHS